MRHASFLYIFRLSSVCCLSVVCLAAVCHSCWNPFSVYVRFLVCPSFVCRPSVVYLYLCIWHVSSVSHLSLACLSSVRRLPFVCLPSDCRLQLVCHLSAPRLSLVCLPSVSSVQCLFVACLPSLVCSFLTIACPSVPDLGTDTDRMIPKDSVNKCREKQRRIPKVHDRGQNGSKRDAKDPKMAPNSFQGLPKVSNMLPKCSEGLPVPELQLSF